MSSHHSDIHFFKRIKEEDTLRNRELRIPRSFVNKCWEGISNPVVLLLPNGAEWKVKWKKLDADIWLIDDWKKFAEFCSLDHDHLLVFKYVEKSRFLVVIFDQNGLEMEYPLMERTLNGDENGNSLCQCKRAKSPLPFSPSIKKVKTNPKKEPTSHDVKTKRAQSQRTKVELSKKFHADELDKAKPKKRGGRRRITCSKSKAIKSEELLEDTESSTALERAKAFRSDNPTFICEMRKTYIQKSVLFMPGNFITKDQQKEDDDHVFLWISEERAWHVKFYPSRSSGQILLSTGWMNFVKDNNLKIGNVCVFEQIKKPGISFRVFIFRDREEFPAYEDGANRSKQTGLQNRFDKRASGGIPKEYSGNNVFDDSEFRRCNNNEVPENHFSLSIKPCQFYYMNVPKKFIQNNDMDNINEVMLQVEKRSWNVKLDCYGRFTTGWSEFMSHCNLEAGDVCHFELIDKKKFVFEVRITRCISID